LKVFIICSVRDQTKKEKSEIEGYIQALENIKIEVHYPPRDTNQKDPIGLNICRENLEAISSSDEIHIFWNSKSRGSLFDLGMAFALKKKIRLIKRIESTEGKSFNNVLIKLNKEK